MWDFTCGYCCSCARISGDGIRWRAATGLLSRPLQYNDRSCRERLTAACTALRPVGAGSTVPCVKKGCWGTGAGTSICRHRNPTPLVNAVLSTAGGTGCSLSASPGGGNSTCMPWGGRPNSAPALPKAPVAPQCSAPPTLGARRALGCSGSRDKTKAGK